MANEDAQLMLQAANRRFIPQNPRDGEE